MGFAVGFILAAVGAVLAWAVDATYAAVDVHMLGILLLLFGFLGMGLSLLFWSTRAGPGYLLRSRRTVSGDGRPGSPQAADEGGTSGVAHR